ncbi:MAG: formylglycine-generating enzyme family protein [Bradymonadia bacterium]
MMLFLVVVLAQMPAPNAPNVDMSGVAIFEGGAFTRGTESGLAVGRYGDGWYVNELGADPVDVASFGLDKHETNVSSYADFLTHACGTWCYDPRMPIVRSDGRFVPLDGYESYPINWVDHRSADWFCRWSGKRLPTEVEWEYAAADGPQQRPWPWMVEMGPRCHLADYSYDGGRCTRRLQPNADDNDALTRQGISRLGGGVAEWVADWYAPYAPDGEALDSVHRVIRGGSFLTNRLQMRPQSRRGRPPATRAVDIGFRCAWSADLTDPPGVMRGTLDVQASSEATRTVLPAPRADEIETIATDLDRPGAVVRTELGAWVATAEGLVVLASDEATRIVDDALFEQLWTDGDGVVGLLTDAESLVRIDESGVTERVPVPGIEQVIKVDELWIWTDGRTVYRGSFDAPFVPWFDVEGTITTMTAYDRALIFAVNGGDGSGLYSRALGADNETETLLEAEAIPNPLKLKSLTTDGSSLALLIALEDWPYSSLVCNFDVDARRLGCRRHTPPKSTALTFHGQNLIWRTQFGVATLLGSEVDFILSGFTPGGMFVDGAALWVTDRAKGRLVKMELNAPQ